MASVTGAVNAAPEGRTVERPAHLTIHQRMIAEIEAALCATDPAVAAVHVRVANMLARRCTDRASEATVKAA